MYQPDSRDIAERFMQSDAFEILEELGYGNQWTTPLADLCDLAEIRLDRINRQQMEHMLFEVLPTHHWRPPDQAQALAQEMRAFWLYSLFELDNRNAADWAGLAGIDLADNLERILRRLAPTGASPPPRSGLAQ